MTGIYVVISAKVEDFKVNPSTNEVAYVGKDKEKAFSTTLEKDEYLTLQEWVNGELVSMHTKEGRFPINKWNRHFDKREALVRKIQELRWDMENIKKEVNELESELSKIQGGLGSYDNYIF